MYQRVAVLCAVLCLVVWSPLPAGAEGSWWDKTKNFFKGSGGEENQKAEDASMGPSVGEIGDAFKEALRIGTEHVVSQLGVTDGFNADPAIHIPLPPELAKVKAMLEKAGMSAMVDKLELKLNRAAEAATPKAKELFFQAIREMTFEDVKNIYEGPDDSATRYFEKKMSPQLKKEMQPIVEETLLQVGGIRAYDEMMAEYKTLPFVPDIKSDLSGYVIEKGVEGIFYYIAKEEAEIRKNPGKQVTTLLKKVFGVQ